MENNKHENENEICIIECTVKDDVEILGHLFHGLKDIKAHVEMSLYKDYSHGEADKVKPRAECGIHVGEMWSPYPCFDAVDCANESRRYQNYLFRERPITQDDMMKLSELPSHSNDCRVADNMPVEMLPMVYYRGNGDTMFVAVQKQYSGSILNHFKKRKRKWFDFAFWKCRIR